MRWGGGVGESRVGESQVFLDKSILLEKRGAGKKMQSKALFLDYRLTIENQLTIASALDMTHFPSPSALVVGHLSTSPKPYPQVYTVALTYLLVM